MKKKAFYAFIASISLTLTACGSSGSGFADAAAADAASETTSITALQPDEWRTLDDMAEAIRATGATCEELDTSSEALASCGDANTGGYMMSIDTLDSPTASRDHRLASALSVSDAENTNVVIWGANWAISCIHHAEDNCAQLEEAFGPVESATLTPAASPAEESTSSASETVSSGPADFIIDGAHLVGTDIQPGTYRTDGDAGCYWERKAGLSGTSEDRITNDFSREKKQTYVTIDPSDAAFESKGCGTWELVQ